MRCWKQLSDGGFVVTVVTEPTEIPVTVTETPLFVILVLRFDTIVLCTADRLSVVGAVTPAGTVILYETSTSPANLLSSGVTLEEAEIETSASI